MPLPPARLVAGVVATAAAAALMPSAGGGDSPRRAAGADPRVIDAPAPPTAARVARAFLDLYMRAYRGMPPASARLRSVAATPVVAALEQPPEETLPGGRLLSLALEAAGGLVAGSAELQFEGSRLYVSLTLARVRRRWVVTAFEPG